MRIIEKLEPGYIYHIYNRGNNGEDIFKEARNYYFFLQKYIEYCSPVFETYAYALLKNHFHLMVKIKEKVIVQRHDGKGEIELNPSRQLSHFFNAYSQAINKASHRHGKLFEEPFKRKKIDSDNYFTSLIYYIHFNAQHHGFANDFREWEFSSWHHYLSNENGVIQKQTVLDWFGSTQLFINAHVSNANFETISHLIIE